MILTTYDVEQAVLQAEREINRVKSQVAPMARLCVGNLRAALPAHNNYDGDAATLKKLKRELASFDMRTGKWKE